MNDIVHASAFIGVGSGLSWLSWALGQKTVLISGFSEPYSEFTDCERIYTPSGNCSGCFNREWLNPGDWEWCPEHKDTPRHFECTKSITPEMVIKSLQKVLNIY
jgi:autotransporter strand-loop-strand O-heptosyltransferase